MKILQIGNKDCAGVMGKFTDLIKKHSKHECFSLIEHLGENRYGYDYLLPGNFKLDNLIKETDIFIFHPVTKQAHLTNIDVIEDGINSNLCGINWKKVTEGKKTVCFLNVLSKFLGSPNLFSTDLYLLVGRSRSRFEIFKLYKKLAIIS